LFSYQSSFIQRQSSFWIEIKFLQSEWKIWVQLNPTQHNVQNLELYLKWEDTDFVDSWKELSRGARIWVVEWFKASFIKRHYGSKSLELPCSLTLEMWKEEGAIDPQDLRGVAKELPTVKSGWIRRGTSTQDRRIGPSNCRIACIQENLPVFKPKLLQVLVQSHRLALLESAYCWNVWWPLQGSAGDAPRGEYNHHSLEFHLLHDLEVVPQRVHKRGRHNEAPQQATGSAWLPRPKPTRRWSPHSNRPS